MRIAVPVKKFELLFYTTIPLAPLAQLVEQLTLNQWVQGSSPWGDTKRRIRVSFFVVYSCLFVCLLVLGIFHRPMTERQPRDEQDVKCPNSPAIYTKSAQMAFFFWHFQKLLLPLQAKLKKCNELSVLYESI